MLSEGIVSVSRNYKRGSSRAWTRSRRIIGGEGAKGSAEYKQVIAVRSDLKMGKGKLAVQVAHAAVASADRTKRSKPSWFDRWWAGSNQAKICVKVPGESELRALKERLDRVGVPNALIDDAGLTQLEPGTTTCLGIGPAPSELLDRFTGDLKLL